MDVLFCNGYKDELALLSSSDGAQMANFCVIFGSCIFSEPRAANFRHAF